MLTFIYAEKTFSLHYDENDASGLGCILEIVTNNDYLLDLFKDTKNKNFIDIGANIGVATIIMAKLNPESTVYTFEPNIKLFNILEKNIEANKLNNVKPYNLAVSNKSNKSLTLSIYNKMSGASTTYADRDLFIRQYSDNDCYTVNCISFDDIIINNSIDKVHVLKIDCEGAEFDIIYDSDFFRNGIVQNIVGEFHDLRYNKALGKSCELLDYCKAHVSELVKISILVI